MSRRHSLTPNPFTILKVFAYNFLIGFILFYVTNSDNADVTFQHVQ